MIVRRIFLAVFISALAVSARATGPTDSATNRLAQIIASGNYTFSVTYGRMGALAVDGYATPAGRGFRAKLGGSELFRVVDRRLWMPSAGTGGAVTVTFDFPVVFTIGYGGDRNASLGFGTMPPQKPEPFILANFRGLAARAEALPVVRPSKDGCKYSETNETGTCIQVGDSASHAWISLIKTDADQSSVFIHELKINAGPPAKKLEIPAAPRTVVLKDYSVALVFCTRVIQAVQHDAMIGEQTPDLLKIFGAYVDRAASGVDSAAPTVPISKLPFRNPPAKP